MIHRAALPDTLVQAEVCQAGTDGIHRVVRCTLWPEAAGGPAFRGLQPLASW